MADRSYTLRSVHIETRKAIRKVAWEIITTDGEHIEVLMSGRSLLGIAQQIQEIATKAPEIAEWRDASQSH